MVEVKNIRIDDRDFYGVYLHLPQYPIHFIMSTHSILAQNNFSLEYFEHYDKQIAVILCRYTFGFEGLLDSEVVALNQSARYLGVKEGMVAKEALMLSEKGKNKEV